MARQHSEGCSYRSRFAEDTWIGPAQYLAENMCDRMARQRGIELPLRFWNSEEWKRTFLLQVRHAHSLLKLYGIESIIRALRTAQGKKIYSLGAAWLDPLVAIEQVRFEQEMQQSSASSAVAREKPASEPVDPTGQSQPILRPPARAGLVSKLRELDGQEEK